MVEENPRTLDWAVAGINFLPWVLNYSSPVRFVQRSSWAKIPQILPPPDSWRGTWYSGHHLRNSRGDQACLEWSSFPSMSNFRACWPLHTPCLTPSASSPKGCRIYLSEHWRQLMNNESCPHRVVEDGTGTWRSSQAALAVCLPLPPPTIPPQSISALKSWRFRCM